MEFNNIHKNILAGNLQHKTVGDHLKIRSLRNEGDELVSYNIDFVTSMGIEWKGALWFTPGDGWELNIYRQTTTSILSYFVSDGDTSIGGLHQVAREAYAEFS